jgi:dephospho-CoA kinase
MKIGITGGIGSGKSYVCSQLKFMGIDVYDCDEAAKRLLRTSCSLKKQMCSLIGNETYDENGILNKKIVADFLLASEENAGKIDAIVHPAVAQDYKASKCQWMECAIIFESGFNMLVDKVVCVVAPEELRVSRVMKRDGISREKVLQWMSKQLPQDSVQKMSDYQIINDGTVGIDTQLKKILLKIKNNQ